MSLLQYTSDEMYSSTELVRKSKKIFDKLNKKEIEKAIILRDGKPNTIIMDFAEYERIISDYLNLKNKFVFTNNQNTEKAIEEVKENNIKYTKKDQTLEDEDFKIALDKIEELEFNINTSDIKQDKDETLKEFWDKD